MLPADAIVSIAIGLPSILIAFLGLWVAYQTLGRDNRIGRQVPLGRLDNHWGSFSTLDYSTMMLPRQPDRVHYA